MNYIFFQQCLLQSINAQNSLGQNFLQTELVIENHFFNDMVDLETFDPNELDCTGFWFICILRKEFIYIANGWNHHLPSPNRNNTTSGRPDVMHVLLHLYVIANHQISITTAEIGKLIDITSAVPFELSDECDEFTETLVNKNNLEVLHIASSAFDLYFFL